jgi:hypothetical protein
VIDITPLTPELLDQLSKELGGCTFTSVNQRAFLSANQSCDVQAAPGNGKTTLLVAKLALLSRSWTSRSQGVCVISHTNAAREEVENKLFPHPAASAFLSYPHFIGTVTAFLDRFIALPYLRGLGWSVQRIDDEVFAAVANSRWRSKRTLLGSSRRNAHAVTTWVCGMELDASFVSTVDIKPTRLTIRDKGNRQPGPDSLCASMRQATILVEGCSPLIEIVDLFTSGLVDLLRHQGVRDPRGQAIGKRSLWAILASRDPRSQSRLRRLLRDRIVFGNAAWDAPGWEQFCLDLNAMLGIAQPLTPAATSFQLFVDEGAVDQVGQARQPSRTVFVHDGIPVQLGSIHSAKGKTVDSILVLETEVWRGKALNMRAMDVSTVLPHALGIEDRDFARNVAQLAAATNVFVAATRPRQLLACALRKEVASQDLLSAARNQGWQILDTTEGDNAP